MLLVTESEKGFRSYRIICGDGKCFNRGHGYMYLIKGNSQEVLCEKETHRVLILVSILSVREEELETGACMHLGNFKLIESVQRNLLIIDHSQKSGADFSIFGHNNMVFTQFCTKKMTKSIDNAILNFKYSEYYTKGGKLKVEAKILLCICIKPEGSFDLNVVDVEVDLLLKFKMLLATEGGKGIRTHGIVGGDKDISVGGHGYMYFKKGNSQEVHHRMSLCQVCFCIIVLFIREDDLEAEASTRQEGNELTKMVIVVFDDFQKGVGEFGSYNSNNVLAKLESLASF
jgi:hypothetical protein